MTDNNNPNAEMSRSTNFTTKEVSRRKFLKIVTAGTTAVVAGQLLSYQTTTTATAQTPPVSKKSTALSTGGFLETIRGQRHAVFINFSNPREIRGMAAAGRYVWAAALNMVGRIDTKDNKYTVYDASLLPPYSKILQRPMAVDPRTGNLWIATEEKGVYRFDGSTWTQFLPLLPKYGVVIAFVTAITINKESEIWIGGHEGLIHLSNSFDPVVYNSRLAQNLTGYRDGEILLELRGSSQKANDPVNPGLETLEEKHGTKYNITGIVEDIDNHSLIWVGVGGLDFRRIWAKRDLRTRKVVLIANSANPTNPNAKIELINDGGDTNRIPGGFISDMAITNNGDIWATTVYGAIVINNAIAPNPWVPVGEGGIDFRFYDFFNTKRLYNTHITDANNAEYYRMGGIFSVVKGPNNSLWFCSFHEKGLAQTKTLPPASDIDMNFYTPPGANYGIRLPHYTTTLAFNYGAVDGDGNFWIGSTEGVFKFIPEGKTGRDDRPGPDFEDPIQLFNSGQRSDNVYAVAIDRKITNGQHLRWFGSEHGLYSYDGQRWQQYGPDAVVLDVVIDKKNICWFIVGGATSVAGIYKLENNQATGPFTPTNATKLVLDKDGLTIWAGTDEGLFRLNDNAFIYDSLKGVKISALSIDATGLGGKNSLWIGTADGRVINADTVKFSYPTDTPVTSVAVGPDKTVWIGGGLDNLTLLVEGRVLTYNVDGDSVSTILPDLQRNRIWIGLQNSGIRIYDLLGNLLDTITGQNGLAYNAINDLALEPNPYVVDTNKPYEDILWVGTKHGISELAIATPNTNYEPNDDRFIGFPLALQTSSQLPNQTATLTVTDARIYSENDIDWYKVKITQRYSRLLITLDNIPVGSDFDLVVYPPSRRSSSNSNIFGEMAGIDGVSQNNSPTGGDTDHPATFLNDSGNISDRHTFLAYSLNEGNQPEHVNVLVSGQPGDYQIGVIPYLGKITKNGGYTLQIKVVPPVPIEDFEPARQRLYQNPFSEKTQTQVQALVLTNLNRFEQIYGVAGGQKVKDSLVQLKAGLESRPGWGKDAVSLCFLEQDVYVRDGYTKWYLPGSDKLNPNPEASNQVADAIHEFIIEQLANCPNLQYLVLVGSDEIIPHRRFLESENLVIGPEKKYYEEKLSKLLPETLVSQAFKLGYHLTDSFYGSLRNNLLFNGQEVHIPELAIGRLVETPDEIASYIKNFVQGGVTTLNTALVTGYDFLLDQATLMRDRLMLTGATVGSLISDGWLANNELHNALLNRYDLIALNGHFDHHQSLAAGYDLPGVSAEQKLLSSAELLDPNYDLKGALLITVGCHSGLNVPSTLTGDEMRDFAQTLLLRGATLIGNTGYGYGDSEEIILSELLVRLVVDLLISGVPSIGKALMLAKQKYLHSSGPYGFSEYDIKVLNISTLYGLPMYEFRALKTILPEEDNLTPLVKIGLPGPIKNVIGKNPVPLNNMTSFPVTLDLPGSSWTSEEKKDGTIFKPLQNSKFHAPPAHPIMPKVVLSLDKNISKGAYAHGVILKAAKFSNFYNITPQISSPTADISLTTQNEEKLDRDFYGSDGWSPQAIVFLNSQQRIKAVGGNATGYKTGEAELSTNLVVIPAQFHNPEHLRRYEHLEFEVYQSSSINMSGPSIWNIQTSLAENQVNFRVQVIPCSASQPLPQVIKVFLTYTFINGTEWSIYPLEMDGQDFSKEWWVGSLPIADKPGVFFIQAVDSDGNVTWSDNKGLLNTWVKSTSVDEPRTIVARLEASGDCIDGRVSQVKLFLQAVGSELGTGVNRIHYHITYTNNTQPIKGNIANSWGYTVAFPFDGLSSIVYWAEDTQNPPVLEGTLAKKRRQIFIVTSLEDNGPGTLRNALLLAKNGDSIIFNLPSGKKGQPAQIRLKSPLPVITQNNLVIDGLLPGCANEPQVLLWGIGNIDNGLVLRGKKITIRGLNFRGFKQYAIWLDGENQAGTGVNPNRCLIEKNTITSQGELKVGIGVTGDCFSNIIRANQITRCNRAGIIIQGPARRNKVEGNFIGVSFGGDATGGQLYGIRLEQGASQNRIGGNRKAMANYITGNTQAGVLISGLDTTANLVIGNLIGANPDDSSQLKGGYNQQVGVSIEQAATNNQVERNIFTNNHLGVFLSEQAASSTIICNSFGDNQQAAIRLGKNTKDKVFKNLLLGNDFKQLSYKPIQDQQSDKTIPVLPKNLVATITGNVIKISSPSGSITPKAKIDIYLVRNQESKKLQDFRHLGSCEVNADGSLSTTLTNPSYLNLTKGDLVALTITAPATNTSELSQTINVLKIGAK